MHRGWRCTLEAPEPDEQQDHDDRGHGAVEQGVIVHGVSFGVDAGNHPTTTGISAETIGVHASFG